MILVHPHALNLRWQKQRQTETCTKSVPGHGVTVNEKEDLDGGRMQLAPLVRDRSPARWCLKLLLEPEWSHRFKVC
jgi:hypothetical protein